MVEVTKAVMLIAEDSAISEDYERIFSSDFSTYVARDGEEAFAIVDAVEKFDVCLVDVIMPVESDRRSLDDTKTTGIRLIEHIVAGRKCSRFVIITVRKEVESDIAKIIGSEAVWRFLKKRDIKSADTVREAVASIMTER